MIFTNTGVAYALDGNTENDIESTTTTSSNQDVDASAWTPEDFTYENYEKLLYGCDYSRQFTIRGIAISGFSESGEAKLAQNKDLVIPATDTNGVQIVGIAQSAFKGKGLTSVEFPTGMMVDYDDTITNKVTKRGNFVIAENAFSGNNLTTVRLPEGVIACLPHAFYGNKIETVKLPRTIWWIETMAFAKNRITTVNFPTTCDFQLEMHGLSFANNFIKSVRLPDYTEVVNKDVFAWNTGREALGQVSNENYFTYEVDGVTYNAGVVYMYTDNAELALKDRIHHTEQSTSSQKSNVQKIVVNDGTEATKNPDLPWNIHDFTVEGATITGLSASGIEKRAINKDLILPDVNKDGQYITQIASASAGGCGLFATEEEGFDYVYLPTELRVIGDYAFQNNGLEEVTFPARLKTIGKVAFQTNNLTSVILPDTVTSMGDGAFATNPKLERINLSKGLTEISASAFGCSDGQNWMTNLTSIELHEGLTKIGMRAFAANNFSEIVLPSTVKEIGSYAFSTKNYLTTPCTVTLNEGLEKIGSYAFRNKVISEITIPTTVTKINANTFLKEYSDDTEAVVTKVYVLLRSQYTDKENFPDSDYHKIYLEGNSQWMADDFTYGEESFELYSEQGTEDPVIEKAWVITGLSEWGLEKITENKNMVIPTVDQDGKKVQGIGKDALNNYTITSLMLPEGILYVGDDAFSGAQLSSLTLPSTLSMIGNRAFQNHQLTEVIIPGNVTSIGENAFEITREDLEKGLTSVTFNEGLVTIGKGAFLGNQLNIVELPNSVILSAVNSAADCIFGNEETSADPIVTLVVSDEAKVEQFNTEYANRYSHIVAYDSLVGTGWLESDFTYDEQIAALTGWSESGQAKRKTLKTLVLPDKTPGGENIVAIADEAFKIPNDEVVVTKFGIDSPNGMTSVVLPDYLKKIGDNAFSQNALTTVDLTGITSIGGSAFYGNDLIKIEIPDTVTELGAGAFATNDITELKLSKNVTVIPQGAFSMNIRMEQVTIPDTVTEIGTTAFAGARLTSLDIPKSVVKIGEKAFHLHHLTQLTIPGNVKEVGDSAFEGTFKATTLSTLIIEEGVEVIGKYAFKEALLEEVHFPNSIKAVGEKPFLNNKGKAGSGVVEVTTKNAAHKEFVDDTYVIKYILEEKPEPQPTGQWKLDSVGWWYQNADGSYPVNSWKAIDGNWYYFNGAGYMVTGWQLLGGVWYYFAGSGAMVTGWQLIGGTWYYFAGSGAMATGWQLIGGSWYYLHGSGAMATGWLLSGGTWYYLQGSGKMANGWQAIGGTWYYFAGSGAMATGWQLIGGAWYYLHGSGAMAANQWIGNYYLQADGSMAVNRWIGPYYVGADGAWIP